MEKVIAVIDLKAFYSYVECIDRHLDPWKTPLVVADKDRGKNTIVLSVTPYLKSRGIPSRLRIKELPNKYNCIYAVPRMKRYIEKSVEVVSIMLSFVSKEDIHVYSIDEAFIDLTSYLSYYKKTPMEMANMIIEEIKNKTGLQATGGIGDNFFLAKVALDIYAKHAANGIAELHQNEIKDKLWPITPLTKIWGIGERMCIRLNKLGIFTVKDLAISNKEYIIKKFGIIGEQMHNHANGIDDSDIHEVYVPKETSITIGQTLMRNYSKDEMPTIIREMNDDLAMKLRLSNKTADKVSLYIGYSGDQGGLMQEVTLLSSSDDTEILFNELIAIYKRNIQDKPIRRISIAYSRLKENIGLTQLNIFEDEKESLLRRNLQITLDNIHLKYGKNICLRASALTDSSTIIERHNQIGGHRQ